MCRGDSPFCVWKYKERGKKQISFRSKSVVLAPWSSYTTLSDKKDKSCHWGCTFSKDTLLYLKAAYWYLHNRT